MSQTDQTATIENVLNYHIFLSLKTFYWSIVDLYHYVYFYWTAKWSSYIYIYIYVIYMCYFESFTAFSVEKNSPANAGDTGDSRLILGSGRSLWPKEEEKTKEEEMATLSWIPAGIIPWTEEPGGLQSIGSQRVWHDRANTCTCIVFNIPSHFDLSSQLWLNYKLCNYKVYWVYRKLWGQLTASTNRVIHTITESLDSWVQFSSVTQSCLTLCNPMDCRTPGLPVHGQLPEFTQTNVHWVGDAIQPSHLLLSSSPHAFNVSQHQVFLNESVLQSRWPKYWSFSFSISPSNEYSELISFRMDWLDLLAVQGTLKSLLQHHREDSWVKNY